MRFNVPGLLGKIAGLPNAIGQGLLGPQAVNPALGLDPAMLQQARQQSLQDLALGLMAGGPGMTQGQTLMAATQNARQGFQGRVFDALKEQELVRLNQERATRQAQIAAVRAANPQFANLPDENLLALVQERQSPRLQQDQSQFEASMAAAEAAREQSQQNWQKDFNLNLQRFNADEAYRSNQLALELAKLQQEGGQLDAVEARKRREGAVATWELLGLLDKLDLDIQKNGTETDIPLFGGGGKQGSLYGQIMSKYKQAEQLGTLDQGVLTLFDTMFKNPVELKNAFKSGTIRTQLGELRGAMADRYNTDYNFLSQGGRGEGLTPYTAPPTLEDIQRERERRKTGQVGSTGAW